jgi:hypothetical protein
MVGDSSKEVSSGVWKVEAMKESAQRQAQGSQSTQEGRWPLITLGSFLLLLPEARS